MTIDEVMTAAARLRYAYTGQDVEAKTKALREAIAAYGAAERERCAKVLDSVNNYDNPMTATDCADAIRALT